MTAVKTPAVKSAWNEWLKTLTPEQRKELAVEDTTKNTDIWVRGKREVYDDGASDDDISK